MTLRGTELEMMNECKGLVDCHDRLQRPSPPIKAQSRGLDEKPTSPPDRPRVPLPDLVVVQWITI